MLLWDECYRILNVPPGASSDEIKRAYRKLAKLYHPDRNSSEEAQKNFVLITEAYNQLVRGVSYSYSSTYRSPVYDLYRPETRREKAARYARMQYEEFKRNNEAFKNSLIYIPVKIFTYTIWLMGAFIAATFLVIPWLVITLVDERTGISMIPLSLIGIAIMNGVYKLKREIKQYF
jgi:hypothetical protein